MQWLSLTFEFFKRHPGIIFVLVGVLGEGFEIFSKLLLESWTKKHEKGVEAFGGLCWILVVLGLVFEIPEASKTDHDAAALMDRAANTESNNLVLKSNLVAMELHLAAVTNRVAEVDPLNQPITLISADVRLRIRGTNFWQHILKPPNDQFTSLSLSSHELAASNIWKVRLVCKSAEQYGNEESTEWFMEFGGDPMTPLSNLRTNDLVRTASSWDMISLGALFLEGNTDVLWGDIHLKINNKVITYQIPQQTALPGYVIKPLSNNLRTNGVFIVVESGPSPH